LERAIATLRDQASADRDAAVRAALEQAAVLSRAQLEAGLAEGQRDAAARNEVAEARVAQVERRVRDELARVGELVTQLGQRQAASLRGVEATLAAHAETTAALATTTQSLREALASPKARGQWGERMAEDVLRLAGFVEHVNYEKQKAVDGSRLLPDYSFPLPKGHVLYMDVKFPLTAYLRYLDAGSGAERSAHREAFLRDVRLRVRELAGREYAQQGVRPSVDYVLLFLPNETVSSFIHEQDPALVDDALAQKVVLCSPLTLFALLGVIRQAFDNFMVEQTSEEILAVLGSFEQQWSKFVVSLDVMGKRLDSAHRAYEELSGARRRALERPLNRLASLRRDRGIAVDDQFLPDADVVSFDSNRGELGA
jgi:DNA recombination protein RmuC